jgi:ketosteroid isomerase-like protein
MTTDDAAIRALTAEFVSAFNDADVDRMMRLYADRYVDVNLPRPEQTHRERAEYYRKTVARRDLRIEVVVDEIIVDGAHAIVRGSIRLFRGATVRDLRCMELWQKQATGWKAIWGIDADVHE